MSLDVQVRPHGPGLLLRLRGDLVASTSDWLLLAVDHAILTGRRDVVVGLAAVTRMDEEGAEALDEARAALQWVGGTMALRDEPAPAGTAGTAGIDETRGTGDLTGDGSRTTLGTVV